MEQQDEVEKMSFVDKVFAAGTIENKPAMFHQGGFTAEEKLHIDAVLYEHLVTRGPQSLKMTVRVGRATKASIENPIVPKVTLVTKFKDFIKAKLS